MGKVILLTQGQQTVVDDEDYEWLAQYKWYAAKDDQTYYALRAEYIDGKHVAVHMHRLIMDAPDSIEVDHEDGDGLNNQRSNLRYATTSQNSCNTPLIISNTSGFKGVSWSKSAGKWRSYIVINYKQKHLGLFTDPREAALAYDRAAVELHGEFAKTNEMLGLL